MFEKEKFLKEEISKNPPFSIAKALIICVILFSTFVTAYYFTTPEQFKKIVLILSVISVVSIVFTLRIWSRKAILNELGLRYDLEREKLKFERLAGEMTRGLNKSEQRHRTLFEHTSDGIIVLDKKGVMVNVNENACKIYDFDRGQLIGAHIKLLTGNNVKNITNETIQRLLQGEAFTFETEYNRKDGARIYLDISSKALTIEDETFILLFHRDVTDKKMMQEHLLQSQKLESIGVLVGGIAHDFNNILMAVLGHSETIRRNATLGEKGARSLNVIEDTLRKAGQMISKLLGFARKSTHEIVSMNLNDVIHDTVRLLERVIEKNINIRVELDSGIPPVKGDVNQIEQVIMNFILNARDAMPDGGDIAIKTACVRIKREMPDVPSHIPAAEYVLMSVSDTGIGIPDAHKDRIFEPFFSTKEKGKGTGLGLSLAHEVVREHRGYITVQSSVGAGSAFTIYLPANRTTVLATGKQPFTSLSGDETVLVVDDEEAILDIVCDCLERRGYKVFAAKDPMVALEMVRKTPAGIELIITDIVMPNLDGRELIKKVKQINPEIKTLAISGYSKYIAEKDQIMETDGFLQKPIESLYLLSTVRRILDAKSTTIHYN